jgi:hypothetical protein
MEAKKPQDFPADGSKVLFTDLLGIERKGVYKKNHNGYTETTELEVPAENAYVFPEEEIRSWKYQSEVGS